MPRAKTSISTTPRRLTGSSRSSPSAPRASTRPATRSTTTCWRTATSAPATEGRSGRRPVDGEAHPGAVGVRGESHLVGERAHQRYAEAALVAEPSWVGRRGQGLDPIGVEAAAAIDDVDGHLVVVDDATDQDGALRQDGL